VESSHGLEKVRCFRIRRLLGFLPMERLSLNHGQTQSRAKNACAKFEFMDIKPAISAFADFGFCQWQKPAPFSNLWIALRACPKTGQGQKLPAPAYADGQLRESSALDCSSAHFLEMPSNA
jgi:hypothetical protein